MGCASSSARRKGGGSVENVGSGMRGLGMDLRRGSGGGVGGASTGDGERRRGETGPGDEVAAAAPLLALG